MTEALVTDLYEVTMSLSYLRERMTAPATFSLFVRRLPPDRGFLVAAGLDRAVDLIQRFEITSSDVTALAEALGRPRDVVDSLQGLRFTGDVWAVPEGRVVLADEPLLEVTAPLPQAQLVETVLLNQVSFATVVASKAARCVVAARGRPVVDFSLRRTHGIEAGMLASRVGAMVGFAGTSNVAGALEYGLPAVGTMAHSYVECFPDEQAAFASFGAFTDGPVTLLVDTYDTGRGVQVAVEELRRLGPPPGSGVRLDSGDLATLAAAARQTLDAAGLPDVRIIASGGLDEFAVDDLVRTGAPIDVFAVGTKVGTSADHPYLDSAYKLVEYDGRPVMKLSAGKQTLPGAKQVFRRAGYDDVIAPRDEPPPEDAVPLLRHVMHEGRRLLPPTDLTEARERFVADLAALPPAARRIRNPTPPTARPSAALASLTDGLAASLRATR